MLTGVAVGIGGAIGIVGAIEVTTVPCAAAQVFGPTMPSGVKPCCDCHVLVAAAVLGPNLPSCVTPTIRCHRTTSGPVEPCWMVGCDPRRVEAGGGAVTGIATAAGELVGGVAA